MNSLDSYILSRKKKELEEEYLRQALYSSWTMMPRYSPAISCSNSIGPFIGQTFVPTYTRKENQNINYNNTNIAGNANISRYSPGATSMSYNPIIPNSLKYSSTTSTPMSYIPISELTGNKNYKTLTSSHGTWLGKNSISEKSQPSKSSTSKTGAGKGK